MIELKAPKILTSFRLSETTRKQIKLIAKYDKMSEADIISLAIEKLYNKNYHKNDPQKFPKLRSTNYLIL